MDNLHPIAVPTLFPVGPVNVYLLGGLEPALIDAGPNTGEAMVALRAGLAAHGYALADIGHLIITHAHPDHYGLAARIVAESGAQVYSHRYNRALLASDRAEAGRQGVYYAQTFKQAGVPLHLLAEIQRGFNAAARYTQPVEVDIALDDKDVFTLGESPWEVVHTPGHARGHICLYHRQSGRLLSGDHLLRDISSNPILEPPLPGETERPRSLVQYWRSLERVAALEVAVALPGHGAPITDSRGLIARRTGFHRHRVEQVAGILIEGPQSAFQIATILFPALQGIQVFLAVSEVIGHLDILEEEGRIGLQHGEGIVLYTLTDKR